MIRFCSKMESHAKDFPDKENFYKIDCVLFAISLAVLFCKAITGYWSSLTVLSSGVFNGFGNVSIYSLVTELCTFWQSTEWLMKPAIIGIMMSFITWQIIYLDSAVPGYRPPTPISYNKYYKRSKFVNRFQLCYIFALAVAPLTTISLIVSNYAV